MVMIPFFILSTLVWQENFAESVSTMKQLFGHTVEITHNEGKVILHAHPQCGDVASAWFYVDKDLVLNDSHTLELLIKVNDNEVGLRYYYLKGGGEVYFFGDYIISADAQWQKVRIPLTGAKPLYGSDFPVALTPGKMPCLYIFLRSELPGNFDVEIDYIAILSEALPEEEK